ncbi:LytR/AlgR family response regulator transcription factor [Spirosoma validum]|uniref:LytTR family transcriptional regulator n=1 Tax=Spirosoma validum TaxID=2771355 RepID=A0A927B6S6_9BACT|nr:LytTR family DNA-binding domain-containing protein [Spirosoma validum]MBD2756740.1 LytTR family transcriptional regulator [Spirosoma validum]
MVFCLKHEPDLSNQLLNWPPLRVYSAISGHQWLTTADLVYLAGEHNYSWLHWADGSRILIPYTLKRMQTQLPPTSFIRLHRSFVVNRKFVERVETHPTANHQLYLCTGTSLPISRKRWSIVRGQLKLVKVGIGTDR